MVKTPPGGNNSLLCPLHVRYSQWEIHPKDGLEWLQFLGSPSVARASLGFDDSGALGDGGT